MEDQIAISRLKQGDLNGLVTLVSRYQAQAVHAAYIIVYDRPLAEDVVQTAFVKVAERIQQFDDGRPFAPWFFRIVVNDALKLAKKRSATFHWKNRWTNPLRNSPGGLQIRTCSQSNGWSKRKHVRSS